MKEQLKDFTLRKEIWFKAENKDEVLRMEIEMIVKLRSNDPAIGYNQTARKRICWNGLGASDVQ
jgi:hypothetical protein